MTFDKLGTTLYDLLANIIPGYLLVLCLSIIEATFLKTSLFSLSMIDSEIILFTILAYFSGQVCHSIASVLKEWKQAWFSDQKRRLKGFLYDAVREAAIESYGLKDTKIADIDRLDSYILSENYLLSIKEPPGREALIAREAFFKSSMVGTAFLSIIFIASLTQKGTMIQTEPGKYFSFGIVATISLALILVGLTILFRDRMMFFNRLKVNSILLMFLAQFNNQKIKENSDGK